MADVASDPPLSYAPGANERTPPQPKHQKRNNRNRKNNNNNQLDGAVSDGAVAMSISTPQSTRAPKQRQQSMNMGGAPMLPRGNAGIQHSQKTRPVSVGAGLMSTSPGKDLEPAYAGPTFSNSPAASALPVPTKFFSKSVPNVARPTSVHGKLAPERPSATSHSSPESDQTSPVPPPEAPQSPLELFFKADRAEKEKSRTLSHSLSPNAARASPVHGASAQRSSKSGKSIFLSELDGDDTDLPSPRTMPSAGRPPPGERAYSSPNVALRSAESEEERQANTRSLKELLFNTAANASMTPPQSRSGRNSGTQTPEGVFGPPSPFNGSGPSTPAPSSEQQNHYSLHYGNRNLSPLFKAARNDIPSRPSGLRQELPNYAPVSARPATANDAIYGAPVPPPHPASVDPNTFARAYLKDQIRTHGPAEMPQLPFNSAPKPVHASADMVGARTMPISVQPVHTQHGTLPPSASSTTPRNGTREFESMENDLRRMLKLNV